MTFKGIFFCRSNPEWTLSQYSLETGLLIHSKNGMNLVRVSRSYSAFNEASGESRISGGGGVSNILEGGLPVPVAPRSTNGSNFKSI